jgi:hypothetical protein
VEHVAYERFSDTELPIVVDAADDEVCAAVVVTPWVRTRLAHECFWFKLFLNFGKEALVVTGVSVNFIFFYRKISNLELAKLALAF